MKRTILIVLLLFAGWTTSAQSGLGVIPDGDRELLANLGRIMMMPQGTHKIYNGRGSGVFDVLYTIDVTDDTWKVYTGGTKSMFDVLYTVVRSSEGYKVYKGDSNSMFNIIYTVKNTRDGIEVYKGDSTFSSDLIYTYEAPN